MAVTFNITYTTSAGTISAYLEYRHVLPDGTLSSWTTDTSIGFGGVGLIPISPCGFATCNQTITNASGAPTNPYRPDTVYQFRIKEDCVENGITTTSYTPVEGDFYKPSCPLFQVRLGDFNYITLTYDLDIRIFPAGLTTVINANDYSIVSYTLTINYDHATIGGNGLPTTGTQNDTVVIPSTPFTPNSNYHVVLDNNDLTYGIIMGNTYTVDLTLELIDSLGNIIEVDVCSPQSLYIPRVDTYRIFGQEYWDVDWLDETGTYKRCAGGSTNPAINPSPGIGYGPYFIIHSQVTPRCAYCIGVSGNVTAIPGDWKLEDNTAITGNGSGSLNPYNPLWGATYELFANGYLVIPGVIAQPCQNPVANNICLNTPNWP
jgi:hypothetical protein